mgnify:CR=1 FL=1
MGFLARLDGTPSHWVLRQALRGLTCMEHRGGCGGDGDSGDGAGILCGIPWSFLEAVWPGAAVASGVRGLAMVFLPADEGRRQEARRFCEEEASRLGLQSLGWRPVPVDGAVLGPLARQTAPAIEQWLLVAPEASAADPEAVNGVEALLFRLRRRAVDRTREAWGSDIGNLYFASISARTVVYKGMVRSEVLDRFYGDLRDERFTVSFAVYHHRFSTNTLQIGRAHV